MNDRCQYTERSRSAGRECARRCTKTAGHEDGHALGSWVLTEDDDEAERELNEHVSAIVENFRQNYRDPVPEIPPCMRKS